MSRKIEDPTGAEMLERIYIISHMFETLVMSSPMLWPEGELRAKANAVEDALGDFYQAMGNFVGTSSDD